VSTPEGKTKAAIKKVLNEYGDALWQHWPVQNGMGTPTLDCNGWFKGHAYAIEAKAPGKKPSPRQVITIERMQQAGAKIFIIDSPEATWPLKMWLDAISASE
jgi:hypothetical protein